MRIAYLIATAVVATTSSISALHAQEPEFAGTWSLDPTNCSAPQESENAPLVITKERYDQHESHCTFKSVTPAGSDWKVNADCSVEGSDMAYDFTLTVSGDTLTLTDSGGPRDFLRCK